MVSNIQASTITCPASSVSPLRQVSETLTPSSLLFFPLTHALDRDAQMPGGHTTPSAGGAERSESGLAAQLPAPLPVELDTNATIAIAFLLGSAIALGASSVHRRFFKRIKNAEWITPDLLGGKRWITGVVTRCVPTPCLPRSIPYSCLPALVLRFFCCAAWVMRITSAFTTHLALAGAAPSSSGVFLPRIEVRDHLTSRFLKPITTNKIQRDAGLKGKTIHIRMAGMDAPEVSETGVAT